MEQLHSALLPALPTQTVGGKRLDTVETRIIGPRAMSLGLPLSLRSRGFRSFFCLGMWKGAVLLLGFLPLSREGNFRLRRTRMRLVAKNGDPKPCNFMLSIQYILKV